MVLDIVEAILDAIDCMAPDDPSEVHPRGVLWRGLPGRGELSVEQLRSLKDAGVEEIILNVNHAGAKGKWKWEQGRSKILKRAELFRSEGFTIGWMPWVWCNPKFMKRCGQEIASLDRDFGGARLIQMDWEGSAEKSAKKGVRAYHALGMKGYVGKSLTALCQELPPTLRLGITTLYFRRQAGDFAIQWEGNVNGHHWSVAEWIGQFYSPWLTSPPHSASKAKATHAPNFQPPILQKRGNAFYSDLYGYMEDRGAGFNAWALKRPKMTAAEAMNAAVEEIATQGHDTVAAWAGHLIMNNADRFDLTLKAFDRLTKGGTKVLSYGQSKQEFEAGQVPNAVIDWSGSWFDRSVAGGGRPTGYVPIRRKGLGPNDVGAIAKAVRAAAIKNDWARGTCVPCSYKTRPLVAVFQKHTATYRGGKLVTGLDLNGLTVFARE
tara:strand:- start:505 stop:1809 length:1305 start_codon:yes stop_codon:yes gene_type:complete